MLFAYPVAMKIRTTCNRDCPDACGILATVEDERIVKIQGDPEHPVTRGFLCYRTSRFLERQYDPGRLTQPLMRQNGSLQPTSWDTALDRIAETMLRIREESGPAAIFAYRCGGSLGLLKHLTDYFFERFGPVTIKSGDICSGAGDAAQMEDFGDQDSNDLFDLRNSKTIVLWGKNPHVSNLHLLPVLRQAKAAGTQLVLIDPVRHRGADLCQRYLQPRPGGDIAIVLAIAQILFASGRVDPDAADYCDNLEEFRAACTAQPLERLAERADLPPAALHELADLFAFGNGPTALLVGWGMQRRAHGAATVRAMDALGAISGNIGVPGGGVSFYFKRRGAFDVSFVRGLAVAPRAIPEPLFAQGILEADDPPVRMVWVSAANPVAMLPDSNRSVKALESRELTVVVDAFMTDTARTADIVLPTTTMFEDEDLVGAYGHHYLGNLTPVVAPPGSARTDYQIVQALAGRVGLAEEFACDAREWKRRMLRRVAERGVTLEALEAGAVKNPEAPTIFGERRRFDTPSGRINLIHELSVEPPAGDAERPLLLMAISTEKSQGSQWAHAPADGPPHATVHPAAAAGFGAGDIVLLESAVGSLPVALRFDERQRRDLVLLAKGGWLSQGRCANVLLRGQLTDDGGGAALYDTPVRLLEMPD